MRAQLHSAPPSLALMVVLASLSGCSASQVEVESTPRAEHEPVQDKAEQERPMRVLVTGFNDWKELGEPPELWRCRDNPSCRLLVGAEQVGVPDTFAGPLVTRLRAAAPEVEWRFETLPVTWDAFAVPPADVDVIVNIGLGVYDRFDTLQLEAGAYNLRRGADAAGSEQPGAIDPGREAVLSAPPDSPIPGRIAALMGREIAGYEVTVAPAREANTYLCNATHFRSLSAVHAGGGRLREVYFLHIPYAQDGDYETLAAGVTGVVLGLAGAR